MSSKIAKSNTVYSQTMNVRKKHLLSKLNCA